jgi:DNA-binding transcriptional regulator YiaG
VIWITKKKDVEQRDPHVREAYLAERSDLYGTTNPTPLSTTPIPNQPIAPIPVPTPSAIEKHTYPKEDILILKGIDKRIAAELEKMGINTIDDLVQASARDIAERLKIDLHTVQEWITEAKKLQWSVELSDYEYKKCNALEWIPL